jgi:small subunit ribosomal protein S16
MIRLARTGRKKIARYRIVAADSRRSRDGRFLETLGTYNPQANPKEFKINNERVAYWIGQGAQPSETIANLLKQDRHSEKLAAVVKGVPVESITRLPERKRKTKPKPTPKAS